MAYELKDGSGSLFKNDRKTADTHADYTGSLKIDGKEFWLNAWIKDGGKGKYMSLSLKPKEEQRKQDPISSGRGADRNSDMNDDIPF